MHIIDSRMKNCTKNSYTYSHKTEKHEKCAQSVNKTCYNTMRRTKK